MKAIAFERDVQEPLMLPPGLILISDSAVTAPLRPVFMPDFDSIWIAEFYFALKICRLGKDIAEKFASRYYDRYTIAMRLVPFELVENLRRTGRPASAADMFDNALTPGKWIEATDFPESLAVSVNDMISEIPDPGHMADEAVSAASRYCTIKTGDIIMPCRAIPAIGIDRGSEIRASIGGQNCLDLKIH